MADTMKVWRTRLGLTQTELSKMLDVTPFTISAWENGTAEPRLSKAKKLAEIFGCTLDDIIFLRQTSK